MGESIACGVGILHSPYPYTVCYTPLTPALFLFSTPESYYAVHPPAPCILWITLLPPTFCALHSFSLYSVHCVLLDPALWVSCTPKLITEYSPVHYILLILEYIALHTPFSLCYVS